MSLLQEFYDKQKLKKAVSKIKDTSNSNELLSYFQEAINLVLQSHTQCDTVGSRSITTK